MKKTLLLTGIILASCMALTLLVHAQGHEHAKEAHEMDHSKHEGEMIREVAVEGHTFAYHLIDMKEKMKGMKNMPEMKATHHLMLYVMGPDGKNLENAKVGYLLTGPGDAKQKAMAMAMAGGFGADVDLGAKGTYAVKAKVAAGDKTLMDEFEYEVK